MLSDTDKILLYLYLHRTDYDGIQGDESITQEGIARAIGFNRTHATRKLNPLIEQGFIDRKKAHIPGIQRRKYVYYLTPQGSDVALKIMRQNNIHSNNLASMFSFLGDVSLDIEEIMEHYSVDKGIATLLHEFTGGNKNMLDKIFSMASGIDGSSDAERFTIAYLKIKEEDGNA